LRLTPAKGAQNSPARLAAGLAANLTFMTTLKKYLAAALFIMLGLHSYAAELKWIDSFEAAKQEAKQTGKPMLVFVGNTDACKDCQAFVSSVCLQPEFIDYSSKNLICTQVLYRKDDTQDERLKKSHIMEEFNIPGAHAVIIANTDGKRIGELSTDPQSIARFIEDIKTIIAKSVPGGRLKYSEVALLDKPYVPEKTYKSDPPKFTSEPLKGRYISFTTAVRVHSWETTRARGHGQNMERHKHTPAIALKMRKSIAEAFPGARITWTWSWYALTDMEENYVELRKLMAQFVKDYGDEMTFWPGVQFEDKFNTSEQAKKNLHEGLELVSQMVGGGYRPKSVLAGHMSVEGQRFLAENEGIHVVQGQLWSQYDVDGQDGEGGILSPYYPSKEHFLKPAQSPRGGDDFVDIVNTAGFALDFFSARLKGMGKNHNSVVGVGPLETNAYYGTQLGLKEIMHVTDVHLNQEAIGQNGYGFVPVLWELTFFQWLDPNFLPSWLKAVREKYPDTQMLTRGEFGEKWREHNPDNSRINLKFVQRGNDMPSEEEGKKIVSKYRFHPTIFQPEMEIRWYFNKDFRLATIQNWKENGPKLVMDYTRYNQTYNEPSGNVVDRRWNILDIINQKQSRPQDKPKPFSELPGEEQEKIIKWYPELKSLTP
jgi:thioredoxin-related protein